MNNVLTRLAAIADELDASGFTPEADAITGVLERLAQVTTGGAFLDSLNGGAQPTPPAAPQQPNLMATLGLPNKPVTEDAALLNRYMGYGYSFMAQGGKTYEEALQELTAYVTQRQSPQFAQQVISMFRAHYEKQNWFKNQAK